MMTPFFEKQENWDQAKAVIDSWLGTPYRHLWMKKGRGADCSLFIGAVLQELGIIKEVKHEFYPQDWFVHTPGLEIVKDGFADHISTQMLDEFDLQMIPEDAIKSGIQIMRGDLPCFSTVPATSISNHAGILMDPPNSFVHSVRGRGVSFMPWGNYWSDKLTVIYRVVVV